MYGAKLRNTANVSLPTPLEFSVTLPEGVTFLKIKSKPKYRYVLPITTASQGDKSKKMHDKLLLSQQQGQEMFGKKRFLNTTSPLKPIFNSTLRTLTWRELTFPPGKGYIFLFKARVRHDVPLGTNLVFSASFYDRLPATGQPYCSSTSYNQSVTVIGRARTGRFHRHDSRTKL